MSKMVQNIKIRIENDNAVESSDQEMIDQSLETTHQDLSNPDLDDTEFHVNLNKAPQGLKNTILGEKVYLNDSLTDTNANESVDNLDHITSEDLKQLYQSLNLTESSFTVQIVNGEEEDSLLFRKNALHLFGVDELSTNDIFDYFKEFKPFAVEWIDDSSCNVIWKNETHAANALLSISKQFDEPDKKEEEEEEVDTKLKLPPQGCKWRIGTISAKGYQIYMRYVRKSDRKIKGAEQRSKYYIKYGNPNYNNMRGLISNSKRKRMKAQQINSALSDLNDADSSDNNTEDATGRKLVSYNIEKSIDDLEEFGISSSNTSQLTDNNNKKYKFGNDYNQRPYVAPNKSKKMHLYSDNFKNFHDSDEEEKKNKRRQRFEPYSTSSSSFKSASSKESLSLKDRLTDTRNRSSDRKQDLRSRLNDSKRSNNSYR